MRLIWCCLFVGGCAELTDAPDTTATTHSPPITIFDKLHDGPGPIAGLPGFSIEHRPDPTRCGGVAVVVVRAADASVTPADQPLADLLGVSYPVGLDFSGESKTENYRAFKAWLEDFKRRGDAARLAYDQQVKQTADRAIAVAGIARMAQVYGHIATTLARGEIPSDLRTGKLAVDESAAFCDALASAALPLVDKATETATLCATQAMQLSTDWWSTVCVR